MTTAIKSCMPVFSGKEWRVRVRTTDGREVFKGIGAGYTMHQAQIYCDSIRRDAAHHGLEAALS